MHSTKTVTGPLWSYYNEGNVTCVLEPGSSALTRPGDIEWPNWNSREGALGSVNWRAKWRLEITVVRAQVNA